MTALISKLLENSFITRAKWESALFDYLSPALRAYCKDLDAFIPDSYLKEVADYPSLPVVPASLLPPPSINLV